MFRYIVLHFASKITIDDVADAAGISKSHAISLFKNLLGQTIMGHIRKMRIVHAKMLLVETNQKILTIAMDCGFGSLSCFYESFMQHTGVSPAAFRKSSSALAESK